MADSRHTEKPNRKYDVLGFLQWEYDRMRILTMLPSSRFYYNPLLQREEQRGAVSSAFCFATVYGEDDRRYRLNVDGHSAKRACMVRYINPLRKMQNAFRLSGRMQGTQKFRPEDVSEGTAKISFLRAHYMVEVLLSWFERARSVLTSLLASNPVSGLMSVTPFVPATAFLQASWDWAQGLVRGHRQSHTPGEDEVSPHIKFLMKCVDEIPRPDDEASDPGGWRFARPPHHTTAQASPPRAPASPVSDAAESDQESDNGHNTWNPGRSDDERQNLFTELVPDDDFLQEAHALEMP